MTVSRPERCPVRLMSTHLRPGLVCCVFVRANLLFVRVCGQDAVRRFDLPPASAFYPVQPGDGEPLFARTGGRTRRVGLEAGQRDPVDVIAHHD